MNHSGNNRQSPLAAFPGEISPEAPRPRLRRPEHSALGLSRHTDRQGVYEGRTNQELILFSIGNVKGNGFGHDSNYPKHKAVRNLQ
jgi:hypothetical protein